MEAWPMRAGAGGIPAGKGLRSAVSDEGAQEINEVESA